MLPPPHQYTVLRTIIAVLGPLHCEPHVALNTNRPWCAAGSSWRWMLTLGSSAWRWRTWAASRPVLLQLLKQRYSSGCDSVKRHV